VRRGRERLRVHCFHKRSWQNTTMTSNEQLLLKVVCLGKYYSQSVLTEWQLVRARVTTRSKIVIGMISFVRGRNLCRTRWGLLSVFAKRLSSESAASVEMACRHRRWCTDQAMQWDATAEAGCSLFSRAFSYTTLARNTQDSLQFEWNLRPAADYDKFNENAWTSYDSTVASLHRTCLR